MFLQIYIFLDSIFDFGFDLVKYVFYQQIYIIKKINLYNYKLFVYGDKFN